MSSLFMRIQSRCCTHAKLSHVRQTLMINWTGTCKRDVKWFFQRMKKILPSTTATRLWKWSGTAWQLANSRTSSMDSFSSSVPPTAVFTFVTYVWWCFPQWNSKVCFDMCGSSASWVSSSKPLCFFSQILMPKTLNCCSNNPCSYVHLFTCLYEHTMWGMIDQAANIAHQSKTTMHYLTQILVCNKMKHKPHLCKQLQKGCYLKSMMTFMQPHYCIGSILQMDLRKSLSNQLLLINTCGFTYQLIRWLRQLEGHGWRNAYRLAGGTTRSDCGFGKHRGGGTDKSHGNGWVRWTKQTAGQSLSPLSSHARQTRVARSHPVWPTKSCAVSE